MKHKLKHPIRSITEPFGKAGLTVAILALVLATTGAAFAAGGLTKSQEKQVTKIAKKYAGKPGATGPAGTAGTNGTNGKDGANGAPGSPGAPGANGNTVLHGTEAPPANTVGANGDFYLNTATSKLFGPKEAGAWPASGTSLKGAAGSPGSPGADGKTVLNGTADPTTQGTEGDFYINTTSDKIFGPKTGAGWGTGTSLIGAQGVPGETGFTSTLPSGKTETGTWAILASYTTNVATGADASISFPIPLAAAAGSGHAFVLNEEETELGAGTGGCTGDATVPTAPAEVLCVYTAGEEHPHTINALEARQPPGEFKGYGKAGAFLAGLHFEGTAATPARAEFHGTWAVTAP